MGNADATATLRINTIMDTGDAISNINSIQKALKQLKMPKNMTKDTEAQLEEIVSLTKQYNNLLDKPRKSNADLRQIDQLEKQLDNAYSKASKLMKGMDFSQIDTNKIHTEGIDKLITKLEEAKQKLKEIQVKKLNTKKIQDNLGALDVSLGQKAGKTSKSHQKYEEFKIAIEEGDLAKAKTKLEEIQKINNALAARKNPIQWATEAQTPLEQTIASLKKIIDSEDKVDSKTSELKGTIGSLESEIAQMRSNEVTKMAAGWEEVANGMDRATDEARAFNSATSASVHQQSEMQSQIDNLQNQVRNYFGFDEIFRNIGRLGREALDTVKELDAAMTETAVVTNFSVSDMWDMLPTYTKNANALGSTIADVYNAATLYYQQGLTTSQSMALANETLKMARIGGIEAAEATDMMTAALRGFNMEINETSAQRINDVYSKLAAITAADTKEIGTAMERTASIASSAGMDFETTSAFLAQMIETTREAPENLGTAMKTIVARFQEMKVDPNTLVDSEGETLDFNRVDKALKSVGISLIDQNNQFRNADDVFLEIASRWDGMTQAQQRYVATIAAGSRQQSRFIAMMQDYDRTIELVDAAYTSAGAGQAQFEKTLESMDSKLNRLKNAWDHFAMGFMNADFLKVGVDAGTKILDIFEKIVTVISDVAGLGIDPFQGLIKSALTVTAIFGGMLTASKLLMTSVGKFSGMVLGKDAAQQAAASNSGIGLAIKSGQRSPEMEAKIKQAKETGRMANVAYQKAFAEAQSKGKGFFGSARAGGKAASGILAIPKNFEKEIVGPMHKAINLANKAAGEGGKQIGHNFVTNIKKQVAKGELSKNQGIFQLQKFASENNLKIDNAPLLQTQGALDRIGSAAYRAGAGIQNFAYALYGTPLQPFGMALNLVGNGLMFVETMTSGLTAAFTAVKTAAYIATDANLATAASAVAAATGEDAHAVATKIANGELKEGVILEALRAKGFDEEAAAAIVASLGVDKYTLSTKGAAVATKQFLASFITSPIGIFVAALAAAAAAGFVIYKMATANEKALKLQGDAAAQAGQDLDTAKQGLEALTNDLSELADNDNALDGLIEGTAEWNAKLAEANAHIIEMMGNYSSLNEMDKNHEYKYVKTDPNSGKMSITQEGQNKIKQEQQNAVNLATANNAIQGALYNNEKDRQSEQYKTNQRIIDNWKKATDEEESRAILENANILKQNDARLENAWKVGIHAALADSGITDTSAIENMLSQQRDTLVEGLSGSSRKENELAYAELMNYERIGKGKYKDVQGNELDIDYDVVKEMLPELNALSKVQQDANSINGQLLKAQETYNKVTEKAGITTKNQENIINDILGGNIDTDNDALQAFLYGQEGKKGEIKQSGLSAFMDSLQEYNEDNAQLIETITGIKIEDESDYKNALPQLESQAREAATNIAVKQQEAFNGAIGVLTNVLDYSYEEGNDKLEKAAMKMTHTQQAVFSQVSEGLADNFSQKTTEDFASKYMKMVNKGDQQGLDAVEQIFGNVDFSNAISTLEAFKKAADSPIESVQKLGLSSQETASVTARAFQDMYSSEDFMEITDDIQKLINQQGHVSAQDIKELSQNSISLKRYLDATGASAGGVAKALTMLGNQSIDFNELTPGIVNAINNMDLLAQSIAAADEAISNISPSDDTGRFGDFFTSSIETLESMIGTPEGESKKWEYGNAAVEQTFSGIYGQKVWEESWAKGKSSIDSLFNSFKDLSDVTGSKLTKVIKDAENIEEAREAIRGEYGIKDANGKKQLTDQAIDLLISKGSNNMTFKKRWETLEAQESTGAMFTAKGLTYGEKAPKGSTSMFNANELMTYARMVGGEDQKAQTDALRKIAEGIPNLNLDKLKDITDPEKMIEKMGAQSGKTGIGIVSSWNDEASVEEQRSKIQTAWEGTGKESKWWKTDTESKTVEDAIDLQAVIDRAMSYGVNQADAMEMARQIALEELKNSSEQKFSVGGQELTEEDLSAENWLENYQAMLDSEQWVTVGQTIGDQIVAAMNEWSINQAMEKSQAKEKDAFTGGGSLKDESINEVIEAAKVAAPGNQMAQAQQIGQYLKEQGLQDLNQEKQQQTIADLAATLKASDYRPEAIGQAVATALGNKDGTKEPKVAVDDKEGTIKIERGEGLDNLDKLLGENGQTVDIDVNDEKLQELEKEELKIPALAQIVNVSMGKAAAFSPARAEGQNNPNSAFHRVGTMARGSRSGYTIPGRPTLTGEEGEELVWEPKRNQAYMVGSNGPQFANISKDAVVWNADQTKRIKKNSGSVGAVGTGARGIKPFGTMGKGTLSVDGEVSLTATAEIGEVTPPAEPPSIPVIADIEVEGEKEGGIKAALNKFFGGGGKKENAHTIPVNAEVTKTSISDDAKTVKVTGQITKIDNKKKLKGVEATAKVTKVTKSGKVEGEPVKVDAKANVVSTGSVSGLEDTSVTATAEVSGTEDVTTLGSRINALNSKSVNVVARVSGSQNVANLSYLLRNMPNSKDIRVTVHKKTESDSSSRGLGKYAPRGWNSLATGTKKPDPRFKGGPTLTGEEGYEVAWLPKEGKSMVLGIGGPEFVDLPKDAVVWTHQESKKILKKRQKTMMPSMKSGSDKKTIAQVKKKSPSLLYGVTKTKKAEAGFFKLVLALTQSQNKMEQFSTSIDKAKDEMDKLAKSVSGSADKIRKQINEQVKNINKANKEAKLQEKKALAITKKINTSSKREKFSIAQTQHSKSKSNNFWVAEGSLVKRNKKGELVLDTKKIKKKANKGKTAYQRNELYNSLIDKGQSLIDEYNKSLQEARDKQDELEKQRDELRDTIHEIFWSWENELTEVKRLQDKVSLTDSFESVISSMQSTLEAGLKAGYLNREKAEVQYQNLVRKHIQDVITKFKTQSQLSRALSNRLNEDASYTDEYAAYQKAIKETKAAKGKSNYDEKFVKEQEMKERYEAAKLGRQYYKLERDETGALVIKQLKEINHSLTSEQYKAITDYYNQLLQDIQDLNSATSDIQNTISSLYGEITSLTSEMDGYAKTIINGMQQDEEDTIDALSDLNSSLQEAFSDLIDSVRKELDRQRKLEQNEKTEKDISNQMNRLAMLRADTSGSNAAEIAQLEKEIAEATGNYEDSLEDQLLDRLQESADEAAKQRERQIEILQTQLEYTKAVGQYIAKAEILLDKLIKGTISTEDLAELKNYYFVGSSGKDGLTKWGKELLEGEWDSALIKISNFDSNIDKLTQAIQDLTKKLIISEANEGMVENLASRIKEENDGNSEITHDQLTSLHNNNLSYQGAADLLLNLGYSKQDALKKMVEAGYTDLDYLSGVTYDGLRVLGGDLIKAGIKESEVVKYYPGNEAHATQDKATIIPSEPSKVESSKTSKTPKTDAKKEKEASKNAGSGTVVKDIIGDPKIAYNQFLKERGSKTNSGDPNWGKIGQKGYKAQVKRGKKIGKSEYQVAKDLAGTDKLSWKQVLTAAKDAGRSGKTVKKWNPNAKSDSNFRKAFVAVYGKWSKFAQGGLANYTGPAWMDGTPSKPELVLNATDTKNFVALKDVLAEATRRGAFNHDENTNNVGDAVFDININVDKIDSDYDVDKVAKRVEKIIIDKAKHRNVTVVGRAR